MDGKVVGSSQLWKIQEDRTAVTANHASMTYERFSPIIGAVTAFVVGWLAAGF